MPRERPMFDRAQAAIAELEVYRELADADVETLDLWRSRVAGSVAEALAGLAVAEALHGVVYVANANAV